VSINPEFTSYKFALLAASCRRSCGPSDLHLRRLSCYKLVEGGW
jgi:hypothetical protein